LGFKRNCISRAKNVNQSEKYGQKSTLRKVLNETGKWKMETGEQGRGFPFSIFQFPVSNSVRVQAAMAFSYSKIQVK
jgi:hypothetical protein